MEGLINQSRYLYNQEIPPRLLLWWSLLPFCSWCSYVYSNSMPKHSL